MPHVDGTDHLTRAGKLYELYSTLLYGPGTWFETCRAAAAGTVDVADLFARLEPGQDVAGALATRRTWPGRNRLRRAPEAAAGPALSAARAVAEVVAVLAGQGEPDERLRRSLAHWRRAHILPAIPLTGADIRAALPDAALATAARRLAVLADDVAPDGTAAVGFVVLLARALRDAFPATVREVDLPVLFDRRSTGGHGSLRIGCLDDGPPGLYPDPRSTVFLVADAQFAGALNAAWHTAPRRLSQRCVVWRLTMDGQPCDEVAGGSLGGAFGVGLAELARTVSQLGRVRPRRLDRRCAVTAGLADDGTLLTVSGRRNKLEAAVRQRWRVVLAAPAGDDDTAPDRPPAALLREAAVRYAADLPAAVKLTRTRLNGAFVAVVTAVALAASGLTGGVVFAARAANRAHVQTIGNRLLRDADMIRSSDPAGALLLGSLAVRLGTPGARAALVHNLMTTHYAGTLADTDITTRLCGGPQTWSPDGRTVAAARQSSVTLWDSRLRTVQRTLPAGGRVTGCAFAPDGTTLAVAAGGALLLYPLGTASTVDAARFTAGGQAEQVQFAPNGLLATASTEGPVVLWSTSRTGPTTTGHLIGPVPGTPVVDQGRAGLRPMFGFSADSRTLAVGGRAGVVLVDVSDPAAAHVAGSIPGVAGSLAFSPDGGLLAVGSGDTAVVWDVHDPTNPRQRATINPVQATGQGVGSVAFTPDGRQLVTGGGGLGEVWNVAADGTQRYAHQLTSGPDEVNEADVSPDGGTAVVEDAGPQLTLWRIPDRTTPPAVTTLPLGRAAVSGVAFPAIGVPSLAVTAVGGAATIWNVAEPARPRRLGAVGAGGGTGVPGQSFDPDPARFSADGRRFALADHGGIDVWAIGPDGAMSLAGTIPPGPRRPLVPLAMSADGTTLTVATDSPQDPLALWDVRGRPRPLGRLPDASTATPTDALLPTAAFAPDGRTLVTEAGGTTVTWWDVTRPENPVRLAQRSVAAAGSSGTAAYTQDSRLMVDGGIGAPGAVWDTSDRAAPRLLGTRPGLAGGHAGDAVFDGHVLIAGTLGAVNVWDLTEPAAPALLAQFASGGSGPFDGRLAVSGSGLLATVEVASVPDGYYTGYGVVRLWDLAFIRDVVADPIAVACGIDGGSLDVEMWRRYAPDVPYRQICP